MPTVNPAIQEILNKTRAKPIPYSHLFTRLIDLPIQLDVDAFGPDPTAGDEDRNRFKSQFTKIFPDFLGKIRNYERITEAEVRYLVLLYLKLSPKEMSDVLGLSDTTIHKYKMRLKKKLQEEGFDSVEDFMDRL